MDIGSGAGTIGSNGGGGIAAERITGGEGTLAGWPAGACTAGASIPSGAWVDRWPVPRRWSRVRGVMSPSSATIQAAPSVEVDGAWASGIGIGGRIAPECAGFAFAGVDGGGA
ncbi:hypothetical protein CRG98_007698 [Punica granatum]|uniref:Uncharacterized protein n=1 Tax=Punica granatum TaxID=22663 RepID=A0A2I0KUB9_PUNGR|nr:hypothetical protein CRG98_007698 [Punica granatum]